MAIYYLCEKCKTTFKRGGDLKCPNCKKAVSTVKRTFRVVVSHNGRKIGKVVKGTIAEARAVEKALINRPESSKERRDREIEERRLAEEKRLAETPPPTLNEIWERYASEHAGLVKALDRDLNRFRRYIEPRFGADTLDAITAARIETFRAELAKAKSRSGNRLADASAWNILELLRRLLRYAIRIELYSGGDPFGRVRMPRRNNIVEAALNAEQFRQLIETADRFQADPGFGQFVRFCSFSACRRSEALALRWEDIDLARETAALPDTKSGRRQTLVLNAGALAALRAQEPRTREAGGLVFPDAKGRRRSNTDKYWQRLKREAGIPERTRLHDLRHTAATLLAASGKATLDDIRGLLRHADSRVTERYRHFLPGFLRRVAGTLDDIAAPTDEKAKIRDLDEARRRRQA